MPLLGFKKEFAGPVERGEKRQTIRAIRKDGRAPRPGQRLYLYTGLRHASARKLGEATCKSAEKIRLLGPRGGVHASLRIQVLGPRGGWNQLTFEAAKRVAIADGFSGLWQMAEFFKKEHGLPFKGILIKWGDLER